MRARAVRSPRGCEGEGRDSAGCGRGSRCSSGWITGCKACNTPRTTTSEPAAPAPDVRALAAQRCTLERRVTQTRPPSLLAGGAFRSFDGGLRQFAESNLRLNTRQRYGITPHTLSGLDARSPDLTPFTTLVLGARSPDLTARERGGTMRRERI
eukprot:988026-Rhodomonas_salina.2